MLSCGRWHSTQVVEFCVRGVIPVLVLRVHHVAVVAGGGGSAAIGGRAGDVDEDPQGNHGSGAGDPEMKSVHEGHKGYS